jgi:hypothetical protein
MEDAHWVWMKWGDHVYEGEMYVEQCRKENGRLVGDPHVRKVQTPEREWVTVIAAAGTWWREQMRVHGEGWTGMSEERLADALGKGKPIRPAPS